MKPIEFSIVVPAYQAAGSIARCVEALAQQTVDRERYEVIVIDDGSTDGTAEQARQAGADHILSAPHHGPATARNAGVAVAQGEIVLFTDADCEPAPDWLARMTTPFLDPTVDGAKGTYRTRQQALVARFVQLEYEHKYDKMRAQRTIDFVDTYAAAYHRRVLAGGEGFDPHFPRASGEDVEFSYRVSRQGRRLVFVPNAFVFHRHVDTVARYVARKYYVGFWRVRMYRLHPDKAVSDSHTPQTLKLQIALMGGMIICLALAAFWPPALIVDLALLMLFLISTIPFIRKALHRDPPVALVAPALLLLRALALGWGFAVGIVWHLARRQHTD
jgi:glycosyltransferase involved in cell wall biosynthesis